MGDRRFARPYEAVARASDRAEALRRLSDDEVIQALAHASQSPDRLLANVLATEALNRMRRARTILANLGEGVVAMDEAGRVTYCNEAAAALLGHESCADVVGQDVHDVLALRRSDGRPVPPEESPATLALERGEEHRDDGCLVVRRDGSTVPVAQIVVPIQVDGLVTGAAVALHDITRRKEAERATRAILDTVEVGVVLTDAHGRFRFVNPAAERVLGLPARRILGLSLDERPWRLLDLDGEPLAREATPIGIALRDGAPVHGRRVLLERVDGARVAASISATPMGDGGVVAAIADVTHELGEEQRWRSLFELDPMPIFSMDEEGAFRTANRAAEAMTGHCIADLAGQPFAPLVHPDDVERAFVNFARVLEGETRTDEYRIRHADGSWLRLRVTGTPVKLGGRIVGMHGRAEPAGDAAADPPRGPAPP